MESEPTIMLRNVLEKGKEYTYENFSTKGSYGYPSALRADYKAWLLKTENLLVLYCGANHKASKLYNKIYFKGFIGNGEDKFHETHGEVLGAIETAIDSLQYAELKIRETENDKTVQKNEIVATKVDVRISSKLNIAVQNIELISSRFHSFAKSLQKRYSKRSTIKIKDEYDVQDLFHSLLHLYFNDIRPEEWTPSIAGGPSRMDFLLPEEKIVVEIKKMRRTINTKQLGDQLINDIHRYQSHKSCQILYCFVYDPEELILNPRGMESDLSKKVGELEVIIKVFPKK